MNDPLSSLVDQIYEAAAFGDLWPQVMDGVAKAAGADVGCLLLHDHAAWTGWAPSPSIAGAVAQYAATGIHLRSSTTVRLLDAAKPAFLSDQDLFTPEEYAADPYIAEWARPNGLFHGAATAIHSPTGDLAVIQIHRRDGARPFEPETMALLNMLRPHLARSATLAARWRLERLSAAVHALEALGIPCAVLDMSGRVLMANALLQGRPGLVVWRAGERLAFADRSATELLYQAAARLSDAREARSFPVSGAPERPPVVAHLMPVRGRARDLFGGGVGFLVLTELQRNEGPDVAILQALFDLTPAEARVARGIVSGATVRELTAAHGVSVETTRTQLKSVLAKTGSRRQAELIAKIAPLGLPSGPRFRSK